MKKLKILILILLSIPVHSQWVPQTSGTTENLNDVYCINENFVVTVGNNGTILKTIDGGINWVEKNSGTTYNLLKVQFASSNVGYVIGYDINTGSQSLLKSLDGGENWSTALTVEPFSLFSISSVNENLFYISVNGVLQKTINGGNTFETINTSQFINNPQFLSEFIGYASGASTELLKTIDGGTTWAVIGNVDVYSMNNNSSFYFFNESIGYVKTSDKLFKTIDGGDSYNYLSDIDFSMPKLFAASENIIWGVTVDLLLNGQPNYTMRGETLTDGQFQGLYNDSPLFRSIYFSSPTKGYGVGWGGEIYKNSTGNFLGINKIINNKYIKIYPNPTSDQVTISLSEMPIQKFTVEILDGLGKKVFSQLYKDEYNITIDTKSMTKGIYFLTVVNHEKKQTQKLIIN